MLRIFDHMMKFRSSLVSGDGRDGRDGLPMSAFLTGLTLVSSIPTKSEKLELIFEVLG